MGTKFKLNSSPISNSLLNIRSLCRHATLIPIGCVTKQKTAVGQTISVASFLILCFFPRFSISHSPLPVPRFSNIHDIPPSVILFSGDRWTRPTAVDARNVGIANRK